MNRHDTCAACGSSDLLEVAPIPSQHSHIVVEGRPVMRSVPVSTYVCTDCGRVEEWVNGREDLARLKQALRGPCDGAAAPSARAAAGPAPPATGGGTYSPSRDGGTSA